jgi:hypothetical protein
MVNLLPISVDEKWGFCDADGAIAIPLMYDWTSRFSGGVAAVGQGNVLYVVNADGGVEGEIRDVITYTKFSDGLLPFEVLEGTNEGKEGYLNRRGTVAIQPVFETAHDFQNGWARVQSGRKYGVIDVNGDWVLPARYDFLQSFGREEQITAFQEGQSWGFVDRGGEVVLEPRFLDARETHQGITPVQIEKGDEWLWGLVDFRGEWTVPPRFSNCAVSFGEGGSIAVEYDGNWGVVDAAGEWTIPPKYTSANAFCEGLSRVYVGGERDADYWLADGKFGYVDREDQLVIPPAYDDAFDFCDGVARVFLLDNDTAEAREDELRKSGWIDRSGRYIWQPTR